MFKIHLTQNHKAKLEVLKWLISDNKEDMSSGRTTLLAIAFINKAMEHEFQFISVFDHYPSRQSHHLVLMAIENILNNQPPTIKNKFSFYQNKIKYNPNAK